MHRRKKVSRVEWIRSRIKGSERIKDLISTLCFFVQSIKKYSTTRIETQEIHIGKEAFANSPPVLITEFMEKILFIKQILAGSGSSLDFIGRDGWIQTSDPEEIFNEFSVLGIEVSAIGLGCMGMSFGYDPFTNEHFVLRVPSNLKLAGVAPLLCAGITRRRFHDINAYIKMLSFSHSSRRDRNRHLKNNLQSN